MRCKYNYCVQAFIVITMHDRDVMVKEIFISSPRAMEEAVITAVQMVLLTASTLSVWELLQQTVNRRCLMKNVHRNTP